MDPRPARPDSSRATMRSGARDDLGPSSPPSSRRRRLNGRRGAGPRPAPRSAASPWRLRRRTCSGQPHRRLRSFQSCLLHVAAKTGVGGGDPRQNSSLWMRVSCSCSSFSQCATGSSLPHQPCCRRRLSPQERTRMVALEEPRQCLLASRLAIRLDTQRRGFGEYLPTRPPGNPTHLPDGSPALAHLPLPPERSTPTSSLGRRHRRQDVVLGVGLLSGDSDAKRDRQRRT